jgi:hypothetical protein
VAPQRLTVIENQAYWFSRYNLTALTMMSGLGVRLTIGHGDVPFEQRRGTLAGEVGFDPAELPKNPYLLSRVYASGEIYFTRKADFGDFATLYWDRSKMDKTLLPSAQALVIVTAVGKEFRSRYHETPRDKFIAKLQLETSKVLVRTLEESLKTAEGLYVPVRPDQTRGAPTALDQIFVLWAYSKLASSLADPEFKLYYDPALASRYRSLATEVFQRRALKPPVSLTERALALEAYAWYWRATNEQTALRLVESLARELVKETPRTATEIGLVVRALSEAGRLLNDGWFLEVAARLFQNRLDALWDEKVGIYAPEKGATTYDLTPSDVGALLGGLQSLRRHPKADDELRSLADTRYAQYFEGAIVRSGMQFAHAIPLAVNKIYLEKYPREFFTPPSVLVSAKAGGPLGYGGCPMYLERVVYDRGWKRPTGRFATVPGMFLADMSVDNFVP